MNDSVAKKTRFHRAMLASLSLVILFSSAVEASPNRRAVKGNARYAAIVMDAQSGKVLSEHSADKALYPASLTKMMTLFLAFEAVEGGRLHMDKYLNVTRRAVNQPPSKLGLKVGEHITVKQAILALVTRSANDVAMAMAETVGGNESNFIRMMNERARSLGMTHTTFRNPHGLPNPGQRSSARDIAILGRALMQYFPQHYHFFNTKQFSYKGQTIQTHNNLMKRFPGMDGFKTGYTVASGFNLAASAVRNNRRVIVVVFGGRTANSRDAHVATLLTDGLAMLNREQSGAQFASATMPPAQIAPQPVQRAVSAAPVQANNAVQKADYRVALRENVKPLNANMGNGIANASYVSGPTNWGIQVGAFASAALGLKALQNARTKIGSVLTEGQTPQVLVVPTRTHNGVIYRARILGLSAQSAARACAHLDECMAFTVK